MRTISHAHQTLIGWLVVSLAALASADELKKDVPWSKLQSAGDSLVFGRFEGQFEGPSFRSRKLVFQRIEDGESFSIEVGPGLGYFEAVLPSGIYELLSFEATYVPPTRLILGARGYRPLHQRFHVRTDGSDARGPHFLLTADRPVYVGTVVAESSNDGLVYKGHRLKVLDEFDETVARLRASFPELARSLDERGITPACHFLLRPAQVDSPLALANVGDPIAQAREYIAEGKFQQAVSWLSTSLPTNDRERVEAQLLVGEALLADEQYSEAIETLGEVLLTSPENMRALRLLARAHLFNGDFDDALNLYRGLSDSLPEDVESRLYLGYMYALKSEGAESGAAFDSAFARDFDYLLHDVWPFVSALRVVQAGGAEYDPPELVGTALRPPSYLRSRRAWEHAGFLSVLIDHQGKVVAAQMSPDHSGPAPDFMMAMIHATFRPAALNGVPIPALVRLGPDKNMTTTQE